MAAREPLTSFCSNCGQVFFVDDGHSCSARSAPLDENGRPRCLTTVAGLTTPIRRYGQEQRC